MDHTNILYNKIGQLLFNIAPDGAKKITMEASLSSENDHCKFQYEYVDENNELKWFTGGGKANSEMVSYLVELKKYFLNNNLTNGNPIWTGCIAIVDVENSKISIEFKYKPFIES